MNMPAHQRVVYNLLESVIEFDKLYFPAIAFPQSREKVQTELSPRETARAFAD